MKVDLSEFNVKADTKRQQVNTIVRRLGYANKDFNDYWMCLYYEIEIEWPEDYFFRDSAGYILRDSFGRPRTNYPNVAAAFKANELPHPLDQVEEAGLMGILLKFAKEMEKHFSKTEFFIKMLDEMNGEKK